MDLHFNLVFFSSGTCAKALQSKDFQMRHIGFATTPCFLRGFGIKSLGWTSIFDVHRRAHRFALKFKFQPLCKNHVSPTFHDASIGTLCKTILLWGIGCSCLSLNSTFCKKCVKFFFDTNSPLLSDCNTLIL